MFLVIQTHSKSEQMIERLFAAFQRVRHRHLNIEAVFLSVFDAKEAVMVQDI